MASIKISGVTLAQAYLNRNMTWRTRLYDIRHERRIRFNPVNERVYREVWRNLVR